MFRKFEKARNRKIKNSRKRITIVYMCHAISFPVLSNFLLYVALRLFLFSTSLNRKESPNQM